MLKRLHTNSSIFFKNPYVIRVVFANENDFKKMLSYTRKHIQATWGYSEPTFRLGKEFDIVYVNYWCFSDKQDVLQFKLITSAQITIIKMWPKIPFTITEYINE